MVFVAGRDVPHGLGSALRGGGPGPSGRGRRASGSTPRRSRMRRSPRSWTTPATSRSPSARSTRPTSRTPRPRTSCRARWSSAARPVRSTCGTSPVVGLDAERVLERIRRVRARPSTAAAASGRARRLRGRRALRRRGPARRCRPRPSGSTPHAAASTARRSPGATSRIADGRASWPTTGTATSPGDPRDGYARTVPGRLLPGQRLSASTTWPATSGSGRLTGTPPPPRRMPTRPAASRPTRAAAASESLDPAPAPVRGRPQGHQGRLVPVRRLLLPPLPARGAPAADDRHRHEPHRLSLRPPRIDPMNRISIAGDALAAPRFSPGQASVATSKGATSVSPPNMNA